MSWILIATDGSDEATTATRLVGAIAWPPETSFGVVGVVPTWRDLVGMPFVAAVPTNVNELEAAQVVNPEAATKVAAELLARTGRPVRSKVMRGRPADLIVQLAERYKADLVVLGSRGLGAFQAALLGSVSAEVVDRAPCPVLIGRSTN